LSEIHFILSVLRVILPGSGYKTPNAGHQARLEAEARYERTLYAVACRPMILIEAPSQPTTVVG
jgi:hypothetical protein